MTEASPQNRLTITHAGDEDCVKQKLAWNICVLLGYRVTKLPFTAAFGLAPLKIWTPFRTGANRFASIYLYNRRVCSRVSCAVRGAAAPSWQLRCRCIMHRELRFNTFDLIRCDGATLSASAAIEARRPLITKRWYLYMRRTLQRNFESGFRKNPAYNMNNSE